LVHAVDPEVQEEVKWRMANRPEGLPVWTHNGNICFIETFNNDQKLVFAKGPKMKDANKLFNARLESSKVRAIEIHEGDELDEKGIKGLLIEALQLNGVKPQD
jgi:hypothetical protein